MTTLLLQRCQWQYEAFSSEQRSSCCHSSPFLMQLQKCSPPPVLLPYWSVCRPFASLSWKELGWYWRWRQVLLLPADMQCFKEKLDEELLLLGNRITSTAGCSVHYWRTGKSCFVSLKFLAVLTAREPDMDGHHSVDYFHLWSRHCSILFERMVVRTYALSDLNFVSKVCLSMNSWDRRKPHYNATTSEATEQPHELWLAGQ